MFAKSIPLVVPFVLCAFAAGGVEPRIEIQSRAGDPIPGLTAYELELFWAGRELYDTPLTAEEGLGPIFNKTSCGGCHAVPLGGWGNVSVKRFGVVTDGVFSLWPGEVQSLLQESTIGGDCIETIPAGAHQTNRLTNSSMAFGFIEAIEDDDIEANEDPDDLDADGISGRVHWVMPLEARKGSPLRAGRFGWKAQVATMLTFAGDASRNEMGLTNRLEPTETPPNGDYKLLAQCDTVTDPEDVADVDGFAFIDRVTHFQRYLAIPPQTPKHGMTGETIFNAIGCAKCHIPEWTTPDDPRLETVLRGKTIRPYSDFLLHDVGDFADMVSHDDATELEMRTPTLWNLRTREPLMHDGSITGTLEDRLTAAIAIHGQFGEGAEVATNFANLSLADKMHLLKFLGSLGRLEFDDDGDGLVNVLDAILIQSCLGVAVTPDDHCAVHDINEDGIVDGDDLVYFAETFEGVHGDCNGNGQPDIIDIILGLSEDLDFDGVPDNCACLADIAGGDGQVDGSDLAMVLGQWGPNPGSPADMNLDGIVDGNDLVVVLGQWGPCR